MCDKKEEIQEDYSHHHHQGLLNNNTVNIHHHQGFQEQQEEVVEEMQQPSSIDAYMAGSSSRSGGLMLPEMSPPILPWTLPSVHGFNHHQHHHHQQFQTNPIDPFLLPPTPSTPYGVGLFNRSSTRFAAYEGLISETLGHHHQPPGGGVVSAAPFGLQADIQKMTAQEIMDAKALAASKSHSEAERRRRERINNHLAKLRSLLPSTTKTDKASLLAEVIQHVKELKRQTSIIAETSPIPTEIDELTVDNAPDEDGKFVIKASLCCEDRSDLLPDLIKTLKSLKLRTLRAEITTLGGRVRNVLFITSEEDPASNINNNNGDNREDQQQQQQQYCISSIQEALKQVMEKSSGDDQSASGSVKRQRTNNLTILGT